MKDRVLAYFNVTTAQIFVFLLSATFLIKLQFVISKMEAQLQLEKNRASSFNKYLDSVKIYSKEVPPEKRVVEQSNFSTATVKEKPVSTSSTPLANQNISKDTSNNSTTSSISPITPVVKKKETHKFSGFIDIPIEVNKLFKIERIDLALALSRYDSVYQYTSYLGITDWRLTFTQKRQGKDGQIIGEFRVRSAEVVNSHTITCEFIERLPEHVFNQPERVVKFKGEITSSGISGSLSWIDRTDGRILPISTTVTLSKH